MGVWIETIEKLIKRNSEASLLMWECGLKQHRTCLNKAVLSVTPYVGVWIETFRTLFQ